MKLTAQSCLVVALGMWGAMSSSSLLGQTGGNEVYQALVKREFGTASNEMAEIEQEIANTRPEQYPQIETKLLGVLAAPEATMPGKQFVCQMLRIVGSAKCIPAVSTLLTDDKLSHVARQVLLGIHDAAVDEALRKALGQTQGNLRIGLINTIGDRVDRGSLAAVAALLKGSDEATTRAALNAIGKIGGAEAAAALDRAPMPDSLKAAWAQAYLQCAGSVLAAGDAARAGKMYRSLFDGSAPLAVRAGAFAAITRLEKEQAVPLIMKTLSAEEAILRRAALGAVISVPGNGTTKAFAQELPALSPDGKVVLLGALAARGDALGLTETVNKLATDENPAIREAAIKALARLGNASSVAALAAALTQKELASSVSQTLVALQGEGVAEALIKQAETGEVAVRQGVLNVLAERRQTNALPAVRKAANSEDAGLRRAALKTLAALGTQEDLATLAAMLLVKKDQSERDQMAQAMSDISGRITDKAAGCDTVLQAMSKADASAKVCLLTVLSTLGGDKALQAVRASLAGEGELRKAAIRALADWPDAAPVPDLLSVAKEDKEKSNQILALRGYIKMLGQTGGRAEKKLASYREAMALAARPDEKRLVLAGLADVAHADALKMVEAFLEDAALGREAFISYEKIAESLAGRQPALAREALNRVVEKAGDGGLRNKAKKALDKIK